MQAPKPDNPNFKDYLNGQKAKWCPGCGNHGILRTLSKTFADLNLQPEQIAVISGIGCSSRLPYYLNTYGFHTLHGRAPTVASGLKIARPELSVWIITGDGDSLAIGGNHFIHLARHNFDINIILFNNAIYGLTKGQASPTTKASTITKSTPFGVKEHPLNPLSLAISAGASFVARTVDNQLQHMQETLTAAYHHRGVSVVEVLVNCIIFNDGAFNQFEDPTTSEDHVLRLKTGHALKFGEERSKLLTFDSKLQPSIVMTNQSGACGGSEEPPLLFDKSEKLMALALAELNPEAFPTPIGILYQNSDTPPCSVHRKNEDVNWNDPTELQKQLLGTT